MSEHRLTLGSLVLNGSDYSETAWSYYTQGEDASLGEVEPIERTIRTLLQDGAVTVTDGLENREATFQVVIAAPDSQALARGEAALALELGKRNELTWEPPDGWGPPSVFEVFTSNMDQVPDDLREVSQCERTYRVRFVCHPTARAVDPIEVPAIEEAGGTPTSTVIDAASATTNWTAGPETSLAVGAGPYLNATGGVGNFRRTFTWSGSVNLTSTPYVSLDLYKVITGQELKVDGVAATLVAIMPAPPGFQRYIWRVENPGPSSSIEVRIDTGQPNFPLQFKNLLRWDFLPFVGTGRQKLRTVAVAGSARTQGSLELSSASSLGDVMIYTWPDSDGGGYAPPLRVHRTSGGPVTGDSSLVSGARENVRAVAAEFGVDASSLVAGTHLLVARLAADQAGSNSVHWSAQVEVNGTPVGPALTGTRTVVFGSDFATYRFVPLARLMLPPTDLPDVTSATVVLTIDAIGSTGATIVNLDEAWLLNTTIGAVSIVKCGTGTAAAGGPSRRLWLDTPTTLKPRPAIYRGHSEDRSDAFFAGSDVASWGVHEFLPGQTNVLGVTAGATDTAMSLWYYARFHTHAYDPDGD